MTPASPSSTASFSSSSIYSAGTSKSTSGNTFSSSMTSQLQITLPPGYLLDYGPASPGGSPLNSYKPALPPHSRLAQVQMLQNNTRPLQQPSTSYDVEGLTSSFASTHIFSTPPLGKPPPPITKPPNPGTSDAPPMSPPATSAQAETRQRQPPPSLQNHPRHPGPIVLPPPPPVTSFVQLQAHHGLSLSPLHPPGMSPLHHPGHPQLVSLTPHGLPPITPSMPPFTMIPLSPIHPGPEMDPMYHYAHPMPEVPPQPYIHHQTPLYSPPLPPSPSTHMLPPHTRPLLHQFNSFSPGIAMSPGAFWGRPAASGSNPHAAVGAPLRNVASGYGRMREPTEYFDPGYFPPMHSAHPGTILEEREGEDQGDPSQSQAQFHSQYLEQEGLSNEDQDQQRWLQEANGHNMGDERRGRRESNLRDSDTRTTARNTRSLSRERSRVDQPERDDDRELRSTPLSRNIFYQTSGMTADSWRASVGAGGTAGSGSSVDGSERERTHSTPLSRDLHNVSRGSGDDANAHVGLGLGIHGTSTVSLGGRSAATSGSGGEEGQEPGSRMRSPWSAQSTSPWGGSER
ncbi:hypothetical protein BDN72DRAFT_187207 [Pluteus cervinus]|uniref:Uncharacterized protein n=1 Tax=Pluteus cervinus TaxID=181527 RepID=A0ACD3B784_9AGAR|nr:hypothetical protein BDN72DRAFT_187207 [Pluteus cervinus]